MKNFLFFLYHLVCAEKGVFSPLFIHALWVYTEKSKGCREEERGAVFPFEIII